MSAKHYFSRRKRLWICLTKRKAYWDHCSPSWWSLDITLQPSCGTSAGASSTAGMVGRLVVAVIAIVVIEIVYHIVLALESKVGAQGRARHSDRMQSIPERLLPFGRRRLYGDCMGRHGQPVVRRRSHSDRSNEFHHGQPRAVFHGCGRPDEVSHPVVLLPAGSAMTSGRIRNNIRRLRFDRSEMTQQELAEKIGVTRQTVIAIEQDKYSPSLGGGLSHRKGVRGPAGRGVSVRDGGSGEPAMT